MKPVVISTTKPRVLFVYRQEQPEKWLDGLSAALMIVSDHFELVMLNLHDYRGTPVDYFSKQPPFDFVFGHGAFYSPADNFIRDYGGKKGLCLGGNASPIPAHNYDIIFYETDWVRNMYLTYAENGTTKFKKAFGINSEIFLEHETVFNGMVFARPIIFDYLGVGSFSAWKRWNKFKDLPGTKLVVGEYQHDNEPESLGIIRDLVANGVGCSPQVSAYDLANLYNISRTCYIPAEVNGGGERSVWEAKACGVQVVVEPDNPKLQELAGSDPKDHHWYAEQLIEGIKECL